jgi:ABC-2 type transport system permease protein
MSAKRSFAIAKRIFTGLGHDKRTIALIICAPLLAMLLFGVAFSGDVEEAKTIIVNLDEGVQSPGFHETIFLSKKIISNLDEQTLDMRYMDSEEEASKEVEKGKAWAAIIFPPNFSRDALVGNSTITIRADKSNVNVAAAMMKTMGEMGKETPISIVDSPVYGKNAEFVDFFVPGIVGFVIFLLSILLPLLSFIGERTGGTLDRLLASPLRESEMAAGYVAAFSLMGVIQAAILIAVGSLVFGITIVGNPLLAFLVVAILAMVGVSLGILLSSAAKSEFQGVQFLPIVLLPTLLLAGVFWPLEAIPTFLRPVSYVIPPTYTIEALRSVMLRGWGFGRIWPDIVILVVFALVFLLASVRSLRRMK